jgi:hypothetical protein
VRATALGPLGNDLHVRLGGSPAGVLEVSGQVSVRGGYQRLTFRNQLESTRGRIRLAVRAQGYAVMPLRMEWAS